MREKLNKKNGKNSGVRFGLYGVGVHSRACVEKKSLILSGYDFACGRYPDVITYKGFEVVGAGRSNFAISH